MVAMPDECSCMACKVALRGHDRSRRRTTAERAWRVQILTIELLSVGPLNLCRHASEGDSREDEAQGPDGVRVARGPTRGHLGRLAVGGADETAGLVVEAVAPVARVPTMVKTSGAEVSDIGATACGQGDLQVHSLMNYTLVEG